MFIFHNYIVTVNVTTVTGKFKEANNANKCKKYIVNIFIVYLFGIFKTFLTIVKCWPFFSNPGQVVLLRDGICIYYVNYLKYIRHVFNDLQFGNHLEIIFVWTFFFCCFANTEGLRETYSRWVLQAALWACLQSCDPSSSFTYCTKRIKGDYKCSVCASDIDET